MNKTTQEMIAELQSALHDPKLTKTEFVRVQAVLLRKRKFKRSLIAQMVDRSSSVIENWISAYNKKGIDGLRTRKRISSATAKLTVEQKQRIISLLQKKPSETGIAQEEYWRMSLVKLLVERETGVIYKSENSYRKLLFSADLSYQKVEFIDHHKDTSTHKGFKKRLEAKLKKGAISMWW
jgi:transposase